MTALAPSPPGVEPCSCDEALALRAELARVQASLETRDERVKGAVFLPLDSRAFCPLCGVGVGFDDEGCCSTCGATVCSMQHLAAHLAAVGLRVGPEPFAAARAHLVEDAWTDGVDVVGG